MRSLSIFSLKLIFFIQTFLKKTKERICSSISFTLIIINLEKITKKFLGAADLTRAQTVYIYKLSEIIIVSKNKNFVLAVF